MTKYKVGDQVKVINYGHLFFEYKDGKNVARDLSPELIGQIGIITDATQTQNIDEYAISGIKGKHAWYDNEQLELIHRPGYKK